MNYSTAAGTTAIQLQTTGRGAVPYKSVLQQRYFNANKAKLEKQGVDVDEFNKSSKGKQLPMRAGQRMTQRKK